MNPNLIAFFAIAFIAFGNSAYGLTTIDCTNCTLDGTTTGTCYTYGSDCCEMKCQSEGGEIRPPITIECNELSCPSSVITDIGNGCNMVVTGTCVDNSCKKVTSYACQVGYWGTASYRLGNCSGCTKCPDNEDGLAATSEMNSTKKTQCYMSSGTSGENASGKYVYSGNSFYCE